MNGTWTIDAAAASGRSTGPEDRVGRDRAPDLGEDPDEVDVEPVARRELAGDLDVVGGIGVRGLGEAGRDHEPHHEGEQVQE